MMTVTSLQTISLLENVLFETPAMAATTAFSWMLSAEQNGEDLGGVAQAMAASPEAGIAERIYELYGSVLGRGPTGTEMSYYTAIAEAGLTPAQIAQGVSAVPQATWNQVADYFVSSAEFTQKYLPGTGIDPVDMLFENILVRTPSPSEYSYYHNLLNSGATLTTLMQYFLDSPEYQALAASHVAGDLETFGYGVATNGGTGHAQAVGQAISYVPVAIPLAGAAYATEPPMHFGPEVPPGGFSIQIYDGATLTVDAATLFNSSVTTVAGAMAALETGIQAHHVAWGVYQGNTYAVESRTGTVGPDDTTAIEFAGVHVLTSTPGSGLFYVLT